MESAMEYFQYNLRILRSKSGMTQKEVANKAGIAINLISRYENGYAIPRLNTLEYIAKVFGVKIGDLVDGYMRIDDYETIRKWLL